MVQLSRDDPRRASERPDREHPAATGRGTVESQRDPPREWLRRRDQRTLFPLLAIVTVGFGFWAAIEGRDEAQWHANAPRESSPPYSPRIAINHCHWSELCLLPGVSTTLAQRIVTERAARGPFAEPADLQRVVGIGPTRQSQLSGWLDFSCAHAPAKEGDRPTPRWLR
jgi:hypothetical protein